MKYGVGDRVRIKSIYWYNANKDNDVKFLIKEMSEFCGKIMTIKRISGIYYIMEESAIEYGWTDEMIEGLVEEETFQNAKLVSERFSEYVNPSEFKYAQDTITKMLLQGANIPNEYILKDENGNVINATKIVLEKKKKEYPKTYEECCKVMNYCCNPVATKTTHKEESIRKFQFLLLYRDAYWRIAGEEMGIGKPWKPDWNNISDKYCIYFVSGDVWTKECQTRQCPFAFPTPEMRDAFYENFKEEIESCKEFL